MVKWKIQGLKKHGWWQTTVVDKLFHTHLTVFEDAIEDNQEKLELEGGWPVTVKITSPQGEEKIMTAGPQETTIFVIEEKYE